MNRQQRMHLYDIQMRAYTEGSVEYINDQWIFFDEETEEASLLENFLQQEIEIFRMNRWKTGILEDSGKIRVGNEIIMVRDHDKIRIRKHLIYSLEKLLEGINDDAFFSVCHNIKFFKFLHL